MVVVVVMSKPFTGGGGGVVVVLVVIMPPLLVCFTLTLVFQTLNLFRPNPFIPVSARKRWCRCCWSGMRCWMLRTTWAIRRCIVLPGCRFGVWGLGFGVWGFEFHLRLLTQDASAATMCLSLLVQAGAAFDVLNNR